MKRYLAEKRARENEAHKMLINDKKHLDRIEKYSRDQQK